MGVSKFIVVSICPFVRLLPPVPSYLPEENWLLVRMAHIKKKQPERMIYEKGTTREDELYSIMNYEVRK
jgi:hypothetical protein